MTMKLQHYEHNFAEAREKYHKIMQGENDASILIKWIVENEINPYGVFHENGL